MPARSDWRAFDLWELPISEERKKHASTCFACQPKWTRSATAIHEATHAAVALEQGLRVEFVAIDDVQEIEVTRLEAALYPIIKPGMKIPAVATRLDPLDLQREPWKVLVAMVAPSCVHTGHEGMDTYAEVESCIAARWAKIRDFRMDEVFDEAKNLAEESQDEIVEIARQLTQTGWVDLK